MPEENKTTTLEEKIVAYIHVHGEAYLSDLAEEFDVCPSECAKVCKHLREVGFLVRHK